MTLQALAERVAGGAALALEDAPAIVASHDLITIGIMADEVRRRLHGPRTSFLRVFEAHADAPPASLPAGTSAGEVRLTGAPATLDAAVSAVKAVRAIAGRTWLSGFELSELLALGDAKATFDALRGAGLDAIAEVRIDRVSDGGAAIRPARAAGLAVTRLTVHAAPKDPVAVVRAALDLQASVGGFRTFAPLPRRLSVTQPTTGYDDVKLVALARLLARDIPSIQVDWRLYGPKLAQVALTMGADDVDGVEAADVNLLGRRRSALEEINGNIRAAGLEPVERDGRFEPRDPGGSAGGGE